MTVQRLVIQDWLPAPVLNGSRQVHWSVLAKRAEADKVMAWSAAKQAGWYFMPGKVKLTVTLVFPVRRVRDFDNLVARTKHLVDGLKGEFFTGDDIDQCERVVQAEVVKGVKQTRVELEGGL